MTYLSKILCFLLLMGPLLLVADGVSASTLRVPADFASIQQAVNAAGAGDVVKVWPGTYMESVVLKSGITLMGTDRQNTIINPGSLNARGIKIPWGSANIRVSNLTVKGGKSQDPNPDNKDYGGGIYVDGSTGIEITDCIIRDSSAPHGGGLGIKHSSVSLLNNLIMDNRAESADICTVSGGGIFIYDAFDTQVVISGNRLINNRASVPAGSAAGCYAVGGGLFHQLESAAVQSRVSISNNLFSDNVTSGVQNYGGGIYLYTSPGSQVEIVHNTFRNNYGLDGGGIALIESDASVLDNFFYRNSARWGGGVYGWHTSSVIAGNTFHENQASNSVCDPIYPTCSGGGAVLFDESPNPDPQLAYTAPQFKKNLVAENISGAWGGGVDLYASDSIVTGNRIVRNTALWGAGMIINTTADRVSGPVISNNMIVENAAADWGGGLGVLEPRQTGTFSNNLIALNEASHHAGGMLVYNGSTPKLINNTFYRNGNGGIRSDTASPVIMNNIITGHENSYGISVVGSALTPAYNDIWGNSADYAGSVSAGAGSISADPLFVDADGFNFHLVTGSPCIDAGNPQAQYKDKDLSVNDMGLYGGPGFSPLLFPESPGIFRHASWYLDNNGNMKWDGCASDKCFAFGLVSDRPVMGDWSGSGIEEIGTRRGNAWYLDFNGDHAWSGCTVDSCYTFGAATDSAVVGNWSGYGPDRIGVFRNGSWYLDANGNGVWDGCVNDICYNFGLAGDLPVVGDWDGDGKKNIGTRRGSAWYLDYNGNGVWNGCSVDKCQNFGLASDIPVIGDWNWDGHDEMGVYRNGTWYLDYNGNGIWEGCSVDRCMNFGMAGDNPVAGIH